MRHVRSIERPGVARGIALALDCSDCGCQEEGDRDRLDHTGILDRTGSVGKCCSA